MVRICLTVTDFAASPSSSSSPAPPAILVAGLLPPPPAAASIPRNRITISLMAACVERRASSAPAAAARPALKRTRIPMGSTADYEETSLLGTGAYGSVVKARHRVTGKTVAIKRLSPEAAEAAADAGGHFALLREAKLLQASGRDNPYVVGFHGLARRRSPAPAAMDDDLCLVMECVGPSLGDLLDQRLCGGMPPLTEATVRAVMWQLLTGAKKMHDAHVIHRDLKPDNILVADDRATVKICDFGIAKCMADPPPYGVAGSLYYMAPEVLLEKPDYDALVDTWSLGCVMAELIDGYPLFVAEDDDEEDQLDAIFDILGVPDETTWPWFSSTPFAAELKLTPELKMKRHNRNLLREEFPSNKLSVQGFNLLSGLLTCNPDKRLTAAAALKHPWFAKMNDAPELLQMHKKEEEEVPSTLPKIKRIRVLCP